MHCSLSVRMERSYSMYNLGCRAMQRQYFYGLDAVTSVVVRKAAKETGEASAFSAADSHVLQPTGFVRPHPAAAELICTATRSFVGFAHRHAAGCDIEK